MRWSLLWLVLAMWSLGCSAPADGPVTPAERLWVSGAVPPQEGTIGRVVDAGIVHLLTTGHHIVAIDLRARRATVASLRDVGDDEKLTGLARAEDSSLWTLSGWSTLVQLDKDGHAVKRRALPDRVTGLHTGFEGLVFQPLDFTERTPALVTTSTGEDRPVAWGSLTVREGTDRGPVRLVQSLASCGVPVADRIPCWLSNAAAVELMEPRGESVLVQIPELLPWTSSDPTTFARNPYRAMRDVWVESASAMWVLVRAAASDVPDRGGERGLWRVDVHGDVTGKYVLRSRARLILGVERGRIFVLTAEGHIVSEEV